MQQQSAPTLGDVRLSEASINEAHIVGKVKNQQWAEIHGASIPSLEYSQDNARKFFMSATNTYYFGRLRDNGRLVAGCGYSIWLCPYFYKRAYILATFTEREYRRIGLSLLIQQECFQNIREQNSCYLEALIHQENTASLLLAKKAAHITGYQNIIDKRVRALHYGSYPALPPTWNHFLQTFEKNHQKHGNFFQDFENQKKVDSKNLKIVWNFDQEYDSTFEASQKLDWSKSFNIIEAESYSQLSNLKLEIFNGGLKSIRGTDDYDSQLLGFIVEDGKVEGLVYLSNYLHIGLGTRFLTLSEITLFEPKKLEKHLPFILQRIHFDLAQKYLIYILMVIVPEEHSIFKNFYLEITEQLGFVDYKCKVISQTKPYNTDLLENQKL